MAREPLMRVAFDEFEEIVNIEHAKRGKACNCFCIDCYRPLIARQGDKMAWSFAHAPESIDSDDYRECNWKPETELHLSIKQHVARDMQLNLPDGDGAYFGVTFDEVYIEKRDGEKTPDLIAYKDGEKVLIEIAVTHKCEKSKITYLRKNNQSCIEIDCLEAAETYFKGIPHHEWDVDECAVERILMRSKMQWVSVAPCGDLAEIVNSGYRRKNERIRSELIDEISELKDKIERLNEDKCRVEHYKKELITVRETLSSEKAKVSKIREEFGSLISAISQKKEEDMCVIEQLNHRRKMIKMAELGDENIAQAVVQLKKMAFFLLNAEKRVKGNLTSNELKMAQEASQY